MHTDYCTDLFNCRAEGEGLDTCILTTVQIDVTAAGGGGAGYMYLAIL